MESGGSMQARSASRYDFLCHSEAESLEPIHRRCAHGTTSIGRSAAERTAHTGAHACAGECPFPTSSHMDSDGTTRAEHARRRAEDLARPERVARCGTHRGSDHSVRRLACRARCRLRAFRSRACRSRRARRTLRGDSLSPGPIPAHALSPVRGLRPSAPSYSLRSLRARAILAHALSPVRGLRPSAPSYSLRSLRARAILAHALSRCPRLSCVSA